VNRTFTILIGIFVTPLAVAASLATFSPLSIKIANDRQVTIDLSSADINRLFVKSDKITRVTAPNNRVVAHNDQSGSIYMNVLGKTPFTAFVTTQKGRHFSLLIVPKNEPGVTVRFIPETPLPVHYRKHSRSAKHFEQSTPYEKTLVDLLRDTLLQTVPPGYSSISPKAFAEIPAFRVPLYVSQRKALSVKVVRGFLGGALAVRVLEIKNNTHHAIALNARDFYRPGVRAVAISKETVPAHRSTRIFEVISNV